MFGTRDLPLFVLSGFLLNLTPGQDTLFIVGRSLAQGRRAGLLSVLGINVGCLIHTAAVAFGLSAILAASAKAFLIVRLAGAAYLVYLGARMLFARRTDAAAPQAFTRENSWVIFRAGLLTNLLNPKVVMFFLAFLPQFVDSAADSKVTPFLVLGLLFITTGTLWSLVLVVSASFVHQRLAAGAANAIRFKRAVGGLFVGLGLKLALSK